MDDDLSLYAAGGNKILRQQERLLSKQEKVAGQQQQMIDEKVREKAQSVSTIKRIASEQGGKPLTTANIASALSSIATTVTNRINQMAVNTTKQFLPIDSQLKKINDLIASNTEGDIDRGFEMIDRLQSRLGIDLGKYSKEIGDAVQKLYDMNRQRKEDKAESKRLQIEKTEELIKERDILRERGINTVLNEKNTKLQILTRKQEKEELKSIRTEEKQIEKAKEKTLNDTKALQKQDTIKASERNKILKDNEKISKREEDLQKRKERIGLKPGQERMSGMLDQSIGEAFRQIKSLGPEIVQLGGDLLKGFGTLGGMVKKVAMGFMALLLPLSIFILKAIGVGIVIFALYKTIKSVIDFFANIFEGISKIWPFSLLKSDEKKNEEVGDPNKTTVPGQETRPSPDYENDIQKRDEQGQMVNRDIMNDETIGDRKVNNRVSDAMKILPINGENGEDGKSINQMIRNVRSQNLNQMSVENQAMNESKPTNNTVIAPNNVTNSSVNSSTQVTSMEPTNFDRSFINLNTVPV
jgi:hypothetical protein